MTIVFSILMFIVGVLQIVQTTNAPITQENTARMIAGMVVVLVAFVVMICAVFYEIAKGATRRSTRINPKYNPRRR